MQIDAWRRMSADEKAAIVTGLTAAATSLTLAGIRHRHPDLSPHEQKLRFAILTLGFELAHDVVTWCQSSLISATCTTACQPAALAHITPALQRGKSGIDSRSAASTSRSS